jgi:tRNA pseudouridine55 synthase
LNDIPSGLILFDKKPGITSFDALRDIKRALETGKVGHTGTLDKFASGLLVVLTGRALKLSRWFTVCDKQYLAKIYFGKETDTLDPEGNITAEAQIPERENVEKILERFRGPIMQAPPAFSAIHINGKRASDLARSGLAPEMKKRPVAIYRLELLSWQPPFAEVFVHCSSGAYIRSLARDIALEAGSRAHLSELVRTKVAGFELMGGAGAQQFPVKITKSIIDLLGMPWVEAAPDNVLHITHGKPLEKVLDLPSLPREDGPVAVFFAEELVAVVEKLGGKWKYGVVFSSGYW